MADVFTKGFLLGGKGWFHPSELMLCLLEISESSRSYDNEVTRPVT